MAKEGEESRRTLALAEHLAQTIQSVPLADRSPVAREAVTWLLGELSESLDPRLPHICATLANERARVVGLASELSATTGMARLEWIARLNALIADDRLEGSGGAYARGRGSLAAHAIGRGVALPRATTAPRTVHGLSWSAGGRT